MFPIIACSVAALAISVERFWSLDARRVTPRHLLAGTWAALKRGEVDQRRIRELRAASPLGEILGAGLLAAKSGRDATREAMQDAGAQVLADLERYLTTLGTCASIAPLLGLLGTVLGMIEIFSAMLAHGQGQPQMLAGGIAKALVATAAGLIVAIPSVVAHRTLTRRVDRLMLTMEREAAKLLDLLHGVRDTEAGSGT